MTIQLQEQDGEPRCIVVCWNDILFRGTEGDCFDFVASYVGEDNFTLSETEFMIYREL